MTSKPGRGSDQFQLRLPDGMRDRIKAASDKAGRSMNAEIVAALEQAYPPADPVQEFMREAETAVKAMMQADNPTALEEQAAMAHYHLWGLLDHIRRMKMTPEQIEADRLLNEEVETAARGYLEAKKGHRSDQDPA